MNNPIIQRELIGTLRTTRATLLIAAMATTLAVLVVLRWPGEATVDMSGSQALQVLRVFGYGLMTALILLVPVFPATSIVRERQQATLNLLINSPMSRTSILVGKFVGVLGYMMLLLVASVPAAAACYAMGGVGRDDQLLRLYLILALLAVQYAALGLLVSSYAQTTDGALRMTYGAILVLAVVSMGPHQFLQGGQWEGITRWVRCLSPIPAVMETLGHGGVGGQGLLDEGGDAQRYLTLAVVTSLVFTVWTWTRLDQKLSDRARAAGKVTDDASRGVKTYRRVMYLWFFDPQRRSELIGLRLSIVAMFFVGTLACAVLSSMSFQHIEGLPGMVGMTFFGVLAVGAMLAMTGHLMMANPVTTKEMRCRRFGRSHWMIRLIAGCALISLGLTYVSTISTLDWGVETIGGIMVLLQVALIVLLTPSLAAGLISGERESGGWQLLQMTPLSAVTIMVGKLMSVMWTLILLLLATLPGYAVMIYIKPELWQQITQVVICLLLTATFALLMTAMVSAFCRRTAAATAVSYTVLVTMCAGTMLFWLGQDAPFGFGTVQAALSINPLAAAMSIIGTPGFDRYNLVPINWWVLGGLSVACVAVLTAQVWRLTQPR